MSQPGVLNEVLIGILEPTGGPCNQAGDLITSVRDMIPDPVYDDGTGEALPDTDGSFLRVQSLYRWLSGGIRDLSRRANWTVLDWTALAQQPRQAIYNVDRRFVNVEACYCNAYRLLHQDELHTIYPSVASAQPLWFSWHHRSDHLELALWPWPDLTEPEALLSADIGPGSDRVPLTTTAGFLPFGWVRIDGELLMYFAQEGDLPLALTAAPTPTEVAGSILDPQDLLVGHPFEPLPVQAGELRALRRGSGGTLAAAHYAGARVEHLSIWARGIRSPNPVRRSTDCIELPQAFLAPLESYVLAKVREAELDRQGAASLMQEFVALTNDILGDPAWQQPPWPVQARAYGAAAVGSLYAGRVVVP